MVGNRLETSRDWGDVANDDYTTTYQYDANDRLTIETKVEGSSTTASTYSYDHTQQMGKSVVTDGVPTSNQVFEYDLQGRMAGVTNQTLDSGGNVVGVQTTEYEYDTAGSRVVATNTVDADNDGTPESITRTEYLTDANNPTGYSQVIEETEFDDQGNPTKKVVYTIGHDQISQSVQTWNSSSGLWSPASSLFFGYDGHGSVRVLYDAMAAMVTSATNNVLQLFHFDAHGNLLNMQAVEALTSYLYSGEAFDSNIGQQYLRARWYDATTGRFNRLDPFFGNLSDPQSLHKYLYVHSDPVNGVDPSGELFTVAVGVAARFGFALGHLTVALAVLADVSLFTLWIRHSAPRDLSEQLPVQGRRIWSNKTWVEIHNADLTAGEMFKRLSSFDSKYYVPTTMMQPRKWRQGSDDYISFSFEFPMGIGQPEFDVRVQEYDRRNRTMSVVTLSGHPLSGFRYFRVIANSDSDRSYTIETGAIDHPNYANDYLKSYIDAFILGELLNTWRDGFTALAEESGGTFSVPTSEWFGTDSLEIEAIKKIVNWRTSD